jgi:hypothetical protein
MRGMCINKKVIIGLAVVAGGVLLLFPQAVGTVFPVLVVLACPLSMGAMMWGMRGDSSGKSCSAEASDTDVAGDGQVLATAGDSPELVRLRAEVDQLRAEMRDRPRRPASEPSDDRPG